MYPNLRRAMHDKGISIEAVSALICVHRNTVSNRLNCNSSFLADIFRERNYPARWV